MSAPRARHWDDLRAAIAGVVLALGCLSLTGASSQLEPGDLSTSHSVVAGCDDAIGVSWGSGAIGPSFSGDPVVANSEWLASMVRLTDVAAACNGHSFELTLVDAGDSPVVSSSGALVVTGSTADITFTPIDAALIARTLVVIHG